MQKNIYIVIYIVLTNIITACTISPIGKNSSEIIISNLKIFAVDQRVKPKFNTNTVYFTFETNTNLETQAKTLQMSNIRLDGTKIGRNHSKLGTITANIYTNKSTEYRLPYELYIPKDIPVKVSNGNFQYVAYLSAVDDTLNSYLNEINENGGITFNLVFSGQLTKYKFGSGFLKLTQAQLGIE
jgi:hypothetical protein